MPIYTLDEMIAEGEYLKNRTHIQELADTKRRIVTAWLNTPLTFLRLEWKDNMPKGIFA